MNHSVPKIQETASVVHYQICKMKLLRKESHSIIIKFLKVYIKKKIQLHPCCKRTFQIQVLHGSPDSLGLGKYGSKGMWSFSEIMSFFIGVVSTTRRNFSFLEWFRSLDRSRVVTEGAAALDPQKQRTSSHTTLALFSIKLIYSRYKYANRNMLSTSLV
jgi:hypothetical protein